jgi:hypothetical protein
MRLSSRLEEHMPSQTAIWRHGILARSAERGRDAAVFGAWVGLSAILIDAAIAHGLFWENDPYWTYWITKTFLIMTVFTLGTALFGIGLWQGLALTAVHTLILEVYYQWFAPVGLPQEPEWLDFNHLWITGVPAHFLAIYGGYVIAWWVWRRSNFVEAVASPYTRSIAIFALISAVLAVVVDLLLTQGLLLRQFPGLTFLIQHMLIAFVVLFAWTAYVGFDMRGWIIGSLMLAVIWVTYSLYLGPIGLPQRPPSYLGYNDLWLKSLPGAFISALVALLLSLWLLVPRLRWDEPAETGRSR